MSVKKDLTRIEDLGEYLHDLGDSSKSFDISSFEPSSSEPTPDLPDVPEDEEPAFGSSDEDPFTSDSETTFESAEFPPEETTDFGTTSFTSPEFNSEEEDTSTNHDDPFADSADTAAFALERETPYESTSGEVETYKETEYTSISEDPLPTQEFLESESTFKSPETFADLKKFAESSNFTGMGAEGNPSFSVLLKNVRYIEDVNDILILMKELGLMSDPEDQLRTRLMRGHLLVPRISEYAAIYLAHKLRRFDIDIQVGLSDEIHPPKHQETPETGVVSKHSLYQNQNHHFHFDDPKLEISQIIIAATPHLEGHQVIRYLGVASEHKMLDGHIVEDEGSQEIPRYYSELAQKLKAHALKAHANAVIGLNYQLTPLPSEYGTAGTKYRLSCTGNLVWVNKL